MNTPQLLHPPGARRLRWRSLALALALALSPLPAAATTVAPPQFDDLVGQADFIVRAVVKSVKSEWRTRGRHQVIVTLVELEVREVIGGTPPQPLVLEMLGGRVGTDEMLIADAPKFRVGDDGVLFIHGNGRLFTPLVALMHGRYPITRDAVTGRERVTRSDGSPVTDEQDVARPMAAGVAAPGAAGRGAPALAPADFANRIRAAIARNAARAAQTR